MIDSHFRISMWKSAFRIAGCVIALCIGHWYAIAMFFALAEVLGVIEELVTLRG